MLQLDVYVSSACSICDRSRDIVCEVLDRGLPQVRARIIDLDRPGADRPANVFAIPTFVLDGDVVSLGNPEVDWLIARIETMVHSRYQERNGSRDE
jgi:hypothetical protein